MYTPSPVLLEEWFTRFTREVTPDDSNKYREFEMMEALCTGDKETSGIDLKPYEGFCKIMIRNILMVTDKRNQYENGETNCQRTVKNIPVCDLLKVWMWYLVWFCVPESVIKYFLDAVKQVKTEGFDPQKNYAECTYDAVLNIPDEKVKIILPEVQQILLSSMLYHKIGAETSEKEWCLEGKEKYQDNRLAPPTEVGGSEMGGNDKIRSGDSNLQDLQGILQQLDKALKEEKDEEAEKLKELEETVQDAIPARRPPPRPSEEHPTKVPEAPKEVVPEKKVPGEEDVRKEEAESEAASGDGTEQTTSEAQVPEVPPSEEPRPQETQDKSEETVTEKVKTTLHEDDHQDPSPSNPSSSVLGGGAAAPITPTAAARTNKIDLPTSYLPLIPSVTGILVMSYLLWKYFGMLGKARKRYRRAHQLRGPIPLEQQIVDHLDEDGPHAYTLLKERKPRSFATGGMKRSKGLVGRRAGHRMIIDIHLEVLEECQKGDLHSTKKDFFEILVQEFMGSEFMKSEFIKEENAPTEDVPKEQVQGSDSFSGFRV
ncbi:SICA antigen [Plasmodium coatneyi]|uniref:SICA antigen n=1 Tax=Plasmodium coatneyi TaxID=208452 RepID=A0A1B1DSS7_9APIC|nr:SICA antigen [Plasmodium coatneyi]ANQ05830.1 SICA antigen [Plasmodium coatneyi]